MNAGIKPRSLNANDIFVLIVDPAPNQLDETRQRLSAAGLCVTATACPDRALVQASERRPDVLIVTDEIDGTDGHGLATAIQAMHPATEIPVLVLSTSADEQAHLRCFEGGAHDVIVKPVSAALLYAKVKVLLRQREMRNTLAAQHDRLAQYQAESERDKEVARLIIDNVGASATLDQANVDYLLRPLETLNGDLMVAGRTPAGAHCFMIADFTGHGLPAAIGVLVAHGVFTAMVSRGHAIETVAAELNRKMYQVLPRDRFLAAILIEIYPDTGWTSVWNGGMPEMLLRRADGSLSAGFPSRYLPLGILEPTAFDATTVRRELREGDALLACSDGVLETLGEDGLFGLERVRECVRNGRGGVIETLVTALEDHAAGRPAHDDLSVLHVRFERDVMLALDASPARTASGRAASHWRALVELGHDTLRGNDPVPLLGTIMDHLQGFGARTAEIYVILTELYSNALEHGLLGLDSALKDGPDGFGTYYALREERLAELDEGTIAIELDHRPTIDGGVLDITVRQSHNGCAATGLVPATLAGNDGYSGRGVGLVRSLCESLNYSEDGRVAHARYQWHTAPVWSGSGSGSGSGPGEAAKKKAPGEGASKMAG